MAKGTGRRGHRSKAENRDKERLALEALRHKAEERLEEMPGPVRTAVHLSERAIGLALWPVRAGVQVAAAILRTPAAMVRLLVSNRRLA